MVVGARIQIQIRPLVHKSANEAAPITGKINCFESSVAINSFVISADEHFRQEQRSCNDSSDVFGGYFYSHRSRRDVLIHLLAAAFAYDMHHCKCCFLDRVTRDYEVVIEVVIRPLADPHIFTSISGRKFRDLDKAAHH